jgi:ribosomal protein S13
MRFAFCYKVAKFKGFFWARRLFLYRKKFLGLSSPTGLGSQPRHMTWLLMDGIWTVGQFKRRTMMRRLKLSFGRLRNMGIMLLKYSSPRVESFWPAAWNILRQIKIRTLRGRRYRLGLPSRNQRTHSNAKTTRRFRATVVSYVKDKLWFRKLWEPRKAKSQALKKLRVVRKRSIKGHQTKKVALKKGKGKKFDVWK